MKSYNLLIEEWFLFFFRKVDFISSYSFSIILICVRRRFIVIKKIKNGKIKKGLGNCFTFFVYVFNCIFGKICKYK